MKRARNIKGLSKQSARSSKGFTDKFKVCLICVNNRLPEICDQCSWDMRESLVPTVFIAPDYPKDMRDQVRTNLLDQLRKHVSPLSKNNLDDADRITWCSQCTHNPESGVATVGDIRYCRRCTTIDGSRPSSFDPIVRQDVDFSSILYGTTQEAPDPVTMRDDVVQTFAGIVNNSGGAVQTRCAGCVYASIPSSYHPCRECLAGRNFPNYEADPNGT